METDPALAGSTEFASWRAHLRRQIEGLAAAVEDGVPDLFAAQIAWSRDALAARQMTTETLGLALARLREVLEESLPQAAWAPLLTYFQRASDELVLRAVLQASELPGDRPHGQLALDYLNLLVDGDEHAAATLVLDAVRARRLPVRDALARVLVPAQRELGRRWHQGIVGVAEEHFGSLVTRKLLARVEAEASPATPNGRTVVVASVAHDAHDLGTLVAAALFGLDGWRSLCLGADVPIVDPVAFVTRMDADLVALSATLDEQRETAARTIGALRTARPGQRVIVGGSAFAKGTDLWKRVGADAYAASAEQAVKLGQQLVG
jgi:methanogenic corrinoid protein MtbC1